MKVFLGPKGITLTQNQYIGQGGQATIYAENGVAYKIYHQKEKPLSKQKFSELKVLQPLKHIIGPDELLTNEKGKEVGFTMRHLPAVEYLPRIFTMGFRTQNGIDHSDVAKLVKQAQDDLNEIHSTGIICVDINPMNFLTSHSFDEIYWIDVDNWQTKSYPASALMPSVRDPKVTGNKFDQGSDWFSWACVMFELYIGAHPYKGRHPDYGKNWQEMMKNGISLFNAKTKMPPNTQDWNVIPKGHLRWFEAVFEHGERTAPPQPEEAKVALGTPTTVIISSTSKFELIPIRELEHKILSVRVINGITYSYTAKAIYADNLEKKSYSAETKSRNQYDFCPTQNSEPTVIQYNRSAKTLNYSAMDGTLSGVLETTGFFVRNERLYAVTNNALIEFYFTNLGAKTIVGQQMVANIFHQHQVFDGIILQDILGTCRAAIPLEVGVCTTPHIKELDGLRIIYARYQDRFAVVIAEQAGKFNRFTLHFSKTTDTYEIRKEEDVNLEEFQMAVLDKGVCVVSNDESIEIFKDTSTTKLVGDSPLTGAQTMYSYKNDIMIFYKNRIAQLKLK